VTRRRARPARWIALAAVGLAARAALRRARAYDLSDRVVLVTGGSRGLGLAVSRELVRAGARVAICARDAETLERARRDLAARGGDVVAIPCDLTERPRVEALVAEVAERLGPIDVLVNNAGTITVGPVETMTLDDFEDAMRANFWSSVHTILAVLPGMRARGAGRIVNVTSIGGKVSVPHLAPYSASKFALVGLSEGLRAELRKDGIHVTTVVPGLMRTGSPRHASFKGRHRAEYSWFSIADALPGLSMDADRAARQIVAALRLGRAEVVLSLPARAGRLVGQIWPGVTAQALALVTRLLPADGSSDRRPGWASESAVSPSWLTRMGDRAGRRLNQVDAPPSGSSAPALAESRAMVEEDRL
jgi:NAD(P)-dependent dehydrogenase (short-subunit alcohol dehydrogenase family)